MMGQYRERWYLSWSMLIPNGLRLCELRMLLPIGLLSVLYRLPQEDIERLLMVLCILTLLKYFSNLLPSPQFTTGVSPSELLLGHCPRLQLDLLKLNTVERVERQTERERNFEAGDDILVRNYHHGDKWLPDIVVLVLFPS